MTPEALEQKLYRRKHRMMKLCITCNRPRVNKSYCQYHKELATKKQHRLYVRRKTNSLCITCGKPAVSKVLCEEHLLKKRESARLAHVKLKAQGICPYCKQVKV